MIWTCGRHVRPLRATTRSPLRSLLLAASVAALPALAPATPLSAQPYLAPGAGAASNLAGVALLLPPDAPSFDAARRAYLARSVLHFVHGDHDSPEEDNVFVLPVPVPWPPGAGARDRELTIPAARPLFLLAALAPGNSGFYGPPSVVMDGVSLGNVLSHAVRGVPVSDGAHYLEHIALGLVLAPLAPGRHVLEVACGACAPARGPWLSHLNGGKRTYLLNVDAPNAETQQISTTALPATPAAPAALPTAGLALERSLHSAALGRDLPYRVYLPAGYEQSAPMSVTGDDPQPAPPSRRYPVLYLLHGLGGGIRQWSRLGLESELDRHDVQSIVVAPAGRAGYWVNHADGGPRWADYVVNDVVAHIDATYRTVPERRARAIGGISMGAHGALQLALNNPEVFGAVGAHSPALRPREQAPNFLGGLLMAPLPTVIPPQAYAARDPITLLTRSVTTTPPAIWIDTGEGDRWRPRAEELRIALRAKGWPHVWSVAPGDHDGSYWSRRLPEYVRFYKDRLGA